MQAPATFAIGSAIQRLPFTVCPVTTLTHLQQTLQVRQQAYGRHAYPDELKARMGRPDESDLSGLSTTFVAIDKDSQRVIGTLRLQSSLDGPVAWPEGTPDDECRRGVYTYLDRFAIDPEHSASGLVVGSLIKASYLWSLGRQSEWGAALAVRGLSRIYRRRGGMDVRAGGQLISQPRFLQQPYVLMGVRVADLRTSLRQQNPSYYDEFFDRTHPDICVHGMTMPWTELPQPQLELAHS